jgi:putative hemolysin
LNEEIGSEFESDEFDTLGGYVFGLFGRQPNPGDEISDTAYRFRVDATDGRRIAKVVVIPLSESESTAEKVQA